MTIPLSVGNSAMFRCQYIVFKPMRKYIYLESNAVPTFQYRTSSARLTYAAPLSQLLCRSETRHDTVSGPKTEKVQSGQVRLTPEKENSMFSPQHRRPGHLVSTCSFCTGEEPAHQRREKRRPAKYNFVSLSAAARRLMWPSRSSPLF